MADGVTTGGAQPGGGRTGGIPTPQVTGVPDIGQTIAGAARGIGGVGGGGGRQRRGGLADILAGANQGLQSILESRDMTEVRKDRALRSKAMQLDIERSQREKREAEVVNRVNTVKVSLAQGVERYDQLDAAVTDLLGKLESQPFSEATLNLADRLLTEKRQLDAIGTGLRHTGLELLEAEATAIRTGDMSGLLAVGDIQDAVVGRIFSDKRFAASSSGDEPTTLEAVLAAEASDIYDLYRAHLGEIAKAQLDEQMVLLDEANVQRRRQEYAANLRATLPHYMLGTQPGIEMEGRTAIQKFRQGVQDAVASYGLPALTQMSTTERLTAVYNAAVQRANGNGALIVENRPTIIDDLRSGKGRDGTDLELVTLLLATENFYRPAARAFSSESSTVPIDWTLDDGTVITVDAGVLAEEARTLSSEERATFDLLASDMTREVGILMSARSAQAAMLREVVGKRMTDFYEAVRDARSTLGRPLTGADMVSIFDDLELQDQSQGEMLNAAVQFSNSWLAAERAMQATPFAARVPTSSEEPEVRIPEENP